MNDNPNAVTPEQFKELRERFSGKLSLAEAEAVVHAAAQDNTLPPIMRLHLATATLDLRTGRSVQSTMARFRRAVGLDPAKAKAAIRP